MKINLYFLKKLKIKPWIKYWIYNKKEILQYKISEITSGTSFTLQNTIERVFALFKITGNTTQESTTGKNKSDGLFRQGGRTSNTITYEIMSKTPIAVESGETFIVSGTIPSTAKFRIYLASTSDDFFTQLQFVGGDNTSATITTTSSGYLRISVMNTDTSISITPSDVSNIQLEEGSTVTSYEPYTGGIASPNPSYPQEIKNTGDSGTINEKVQNKNLFDNAKIGEYYDSSGKFVTWASAITTSYISASEGNIFTISSGSNSSGIVIASFDKDYNLLQRSAISGTTLTHTCPANTAYIIGSNYIGTQTTNQLEQGSTASDYTAHAEQNISFPLQEGQKLMEGDYLADDGVHHVRGQVVLDGSEDENWTSDYNSSNIYRFIARAYSSIIKGSSTLLSDKFINDNTDTHLFTNGYSSNRSNGYLSFCNTSITDLTSWKTWLSNNPITVEYDLESEVIDPYTEEQAEVWEQIKALRTYKPVTHISSEDETPAILQIQYWEVASNE